MLYDAWLRQQYGRLYEQYMGERRREDGPDAIEAEFTVKEWTDPPLTDEAPYRKGHITGEYSLTMKPD